MPDKQDPTPLDDALQTVVIGDLKTIAEQPAMLSNLVFSNLIANVNLSQQNAVANQQAMNQVLVAVTGKVVNMLSTLGPVEALSIQKMFDGNDAAQQIADLKAALAASPAPAPKTDKKQAK
jgi:hypothetical protein